MVEQKVIRHQYHTYFNWEGKNANKFFSLFGPEFSEKAQNHVRDNAALEQSIHDFLELGDTRNRLVHLDYVSFDVDKSPEDIIALYRSALAFISFLREWLLNESPEQPPQKAGSSA
jgi:RiboL-PSP-HEPN